ncbi:MAG: hypothetical protein Q27BB25_02860 [Blastomonas sp. CACIA14H2]|nr:MAG: hypothetical protein Q27BB25_02860 [Blastomonas sp. CACIA14H2]
MLRRNDVRVWADKYPVTRIIEQFYLALQDVDINERSCGENDIDIAINRASGQLPEGKFLTRAIIGCVARVWPPDAYHRNPALGCHSHKLERNLTLALRAELTPHND